MIAWPIQTEGRLIHWGPVWEWISTALITLFLPVLCHIQQLPHIVTLALLLPLLVQPFFPLHHFQTNLLLSSLRRFPAQCLHPELLAEPITAVTSSFT